MNETSSTTIAFNRKARHLYHIEEEVEAGIALLGTEVKSLRQGRVNISDAHAGEKEDAIWLFNLTIPEYSGGNRFNHEPKRPRKLLLHKKQMQKLLGRIKSKGTTLVPISLYFNRRGLVKIKIGLGTGKKEYEKRDAIKKRDWERDKARIMREKK